MGVGAAEFRETERDAVDMEMPHVYMNLQDPISINHLNLSKLGFTALTRHFPVESGKERERERESSGALITCRFPLRRLFWSLF